MNPVQRPDSFEAADYVGVLRRRWWIVLALTCVGLVGAFGYVTVAPKTYTATASVNVNPTAADQSNAVAGSRTSGATVNLDTEAQVVTSTAVATLAGQMLHSTLTPYKLAAQINVTVPPNSSILDIACKASTAAGAADCANNFAKAYLQNRQQSAVSDVQAQLKRCGRAVTRSTRSSARRAPRSVPCRRTHRSGPPTPRSWIGQEQADQGTQEYATTNGELADTNGGSINNIATPPGKPAVPRSC